MQEIDLDINNYDLDDILHLFKLNYNFSENDLKRAKIIALKTHPDKSNLKPHIFRFFKDAYNILVKIYRFRERSKKDMTNTEYDSTENLAKGNEKILEKVKKKPTKDFNNWFNDMFDKVDAGEKRVGYGDWLASDEDINVEKAKNMNDFGKIFEKKKEAVRATHIIKYNDISDYNTNAGFMLNSSEEKVYSSDIFSKLRYEDVKVAHTETVVPVSKKDFENRKQFSSVDEYSRYRESNAPEILSKEQSKFMLNKKKEENDILATNRAYDLYRQEMENDKKNTEWWKYMSLLENK